MARIKNIYNKTLRQEYTKLRDIARKRIILAKQKGINSSAIKKHFGGFHRLRDIKDNDLFTSELKALRAFVANKTETTVTGWNKVQDKIFDTLTSKGGYLEGTDMKKEDMLTYGIFMQLTNVAEKESKALGSPPAVAIYADMFLDKDHSESEKKKLLQEYARFIYKNQNTDEGKDDVKNIIEKYQKEFGTKTARFVNRGKVQNVRNAYNKRFDYDV